MFILKYIDKGVAEILNYIMCITDIVKPKRKMCPN